MATRYRVYSNGGTGGPVDYSAPAADALADPLWSPPPLAPSTDTTFAVRCYDDVTGAEEANTVAAFRIVLDASGADVTRRPAPPAAASADPRPAGAARAHWSYRTPPGSDPPSGFRVYLGTPAADYAAPARTVPYFAGRSRYATGPESGPLGGDLTGLADGVAYQVAVRAFNAWGEHPEAALAAVVGRVAAPGPPEPVAAEAVP